MATYDLTTTTPTSLQKGDILNCPYSGSVKSITLPKGKYKLECWGAQGGAYSNYRGGYGGYSYGTIQITTDTIFNLYAGGYPGTAKSAGWNGGSACGNYGGGGGGASDIRIASTSLYARVIVAGGGGGAGYSSATGGYGGGTSGGSGSGTGTYAHGGGGTQTAGGTGYSSSNVGSFGNGGGSSSLNGGGGGGGWYGGGHGQGGSKDSAGGGGSGYVYNASSATNYPSGCLLTSQYYLTSSSTIGGGSSITDYSGSTTTGHAGNGACRITVIELESEATLLGQDQIKFIQFGENAITKMFIGNNIVFSGTKYVGNVTLHLSAIGQYASILTNLRAEYEDGQITVYCPTSTGVRPASFRMSGYVGALSTYQRGQEGYCILTNLPEGISEYNITFYCNTNYDSSSSTSATNTVDINVQPVVANPNKANTYKLTYRSTNDTTLLPIQISTEDFTRYIGDCSNYYGFPDVYIDGIPAGATITAGPNSYMLASRIFKSDASTVIPSTQLDTTTFSFTMPEEDVIIHLQGMGCFVAGTPILMSDGEYKNIENIELGDKVVCYDKNMNQDIINDVVQLIPNINKSFVKITVDYKNETIVCTEGHKIYSHDRNEYVAAKDLQINEKLKSIDGYCTITNLEYFEQEQPVYNFTVENCHNYYVGENSILAHNAIS